jgi:hypothetical protein
MPKQDKQTPEQAIREIKEAYMDFVHGHQRRPSGVELKAYGITIAKIKHHFTNIGGLHDEMLDDVSSILLTEHTYSARYSKEAIQKMISKAKRAFITCAVSGREVDTDALRAAQKYCRENKALLIIMPAKDLGSGQSGNMDEYVLSGAFWDEVVLFDDYQFCDKLHLSGIKLNAKQIYPGTGLKRLCSKMGSFVVGGAKQFLHHIPQNHASDYPHMVAVTGAITKQDYSTPNYMSARTAKIAEVDHQIGGLIVESDGNIFNARHVTYSDGCFVTKGKSYGKKRKKPKCLAAVMGDLHPGQEDVHAVADTISQLIKPYKPEKIIIGDYFDGATFNRHVVGRIKETSIIRDQFPTMADEFEHAINLWREFADLCNELQFTPSNHPDWIDQFITKGDFSKINNLEDMELCGHLFSAAARGENLVKAGMEFVCDSRSIKPINNIVFNDRMDSVIIAGRETNIHGDIGPNGARGTPANLEACYGAGVSQHTHSASLIRLYAVVGTLTKLRQAYNKGPSGWTQTNALLWDNNSLELYTRVNGKYHR